VAVNRFNGRTAHESRLQSETGKVVGERMNSIAFKLLLTASVAFLIYTFIHEPGELTPEDKAKVFERNWNHTPAKEQDVIIDTDIDTTDLKIIYGFTYSSVVITEYKFHDSIRVEYRRQLEENRDTVVVIYHKRIRLASMKDHRVLTQQQYRYLANYEEPVTTPYTVVISSDKTRDTTAVKKFMHWLHHGQ